MTARKKPRGRTAPRKPPTGARALLVLGIGLVTLALAWLVLASPRTQPLAPAHIGGKVGDFALVDLAGQPVRLSDFAGRPVLINAWATWCPPCRGEMPALESYYTAHEADGLVLLAVNAGESRATVNAFIAQTGFTFPVLLDPGQRVLSGLGIQAFPTSILIGRDGRVMYMQAGALTPEMLESRLTPLLGS